MVQRNSSYLQAIGSLPFPENDRHDSFFTSLKFKRHFCQELKRDLLGRRMVCAQSGSHCNLVVALYNQEFDH